ncbi:MAG: YceD family protein [Terriglobia bacterium]
MRITREELALDPLILDKSYPADRFQNLSDEFELAAAVRVQGGAELIGTDIRIHGVVATLVEAKCDRCANPVALPVEQSFDLLYRPLAATAREEDVEIPADELDVGFYSGEGVNLTEVVKEQIILALPMKVVCNPDCRGLCPVCGANLNTASCRCREPQHESPFGSLLKDSSR